MNTEANLQAIGVGIQPPSVHSNPISLKRPRDDESNKQYIQARLQIYAQVSTRTFHPFPFQLKPLYHSFN